jgi:cholesterol oxidase
MQVIEQAATNLGAELTWEDILLSVSFADEQDRTAPGLLLDDGRRNLHGRPRVTCQLCGECNFGCNYRDRA